MIDPTDFLIIQAMKSGKFKLLEQKEDELIVDFKLSENFFGIAHLKGNVKERYLEFMKKYERVL